jgi:hypothetical protein
MSDERTGKQKIDDGEWADCYYCDKIFKRRTETARYCKHCERAFCEGNHGTFEGKRFGICIQCYKT